jgi:hypothetical protein
MVLSNPGFGGLLGRGDMYDSTVHENGITVSVFFNEYVSHPRLLLTKGPSFNGKFRQGVPVRLAHNAWAR